MTSIRRYARPRDLAEALATRRSDPGAAWLAGGTLLLAGDGRDKPESVIDLGSALPRTIEARPDELAIDALATFQDMAASKAMPACLSEAALTMVNRNTRNRATLGGNLGADKSCSSLIPMLIVLGAEVEAVSTEASGAGPTRYAIEHWLAAREPGGRMASELALRVIVPLRPSPRAAYRRWNRVSCDLSVLGAAAAFALEGGRVVGLRLALGGLGPRARRFPRLEALFEGRPLPSREEIEAVVAPELRPVDDLRASAAFKRLRGAQLVAEALLAASVSEPIGEARS